MTTTLRPTPSPNEAQIRTPLARVRGLGSAKEGTDHFWRQRVTAVANLVLVIFAVFLVLRLVGASYGQASEMLANPLVTIALGMLVLSGVIHMRLGMQTVIEDYIHSEGLKIVLLMLNTFFAIAVGATCILAVLKLAFGS
ncbi:MAG TPA: succinate dehydrogenase, hydrophobic membrane anchor protein [Hyphomicrobiaceae bacterium]|nr:succinate dehydrogenase, hydrophobic membrane anchor protein [Hyphomicrobiaceae bacterium]